MVRTTSLTKRSLISKANSTMVVATSLAVFVLVFALVAGKSLLGQMAYQNQVISRKKQALNVLRADLQARDSLAESYNSFVASDPNVLGGSLKGSGDSDGDNAKLVLDALPSKYDFPALTASLEKLILGQGLQISGISGSDDEANQADKQSSSNPQPINIPFQIQVRGSYAAVQNLVSVMQRSIRPFQISVIDLSGDENNMTAVISAQTFYQPQKNLDIVQEVVR